jgi:hypothetical protein
MTISRRSAVRRAIQAANLKMVRAMKHSQAINDCIAEYVRGEPYEIVTDSDGEETLHIRTPPPLEIAVLVGELLYQVRSTLDHIFFDLVERNYAHGQLPSGWERKCQFPLLMKRPKAFGGPGPVPRQHFEPSVMGLTDDAFTYIESLQPYHAERQASQLLRLLVQLSNIDKHRRLNTTVLLVTVQERVVTQKGFISMASRPMLDHGTKIETPRHEPEVVADAMDVKREFLPKIAFDEPTVGPPVPIETVMNQLPTFVMGMVVPVFKDLLSKP